MSLQNHKRDVRCLKALLDEVDKSTSKTKAIIEKASKYIECTEQSEFDNWKIDKKELNNLYKIKVWLHHKNTVHVTLPGTSMEEAARAASAKRSMEEAARAASANRSNRYRYRLRNTVAKNYKVTANRTLKVKNKKGNVMMKEQFVPPIADQDQAVDGLCTLVRKPEMDVTETRDAKKRKDEDDIVLLNI